MCAVTGISLFSIAFLVIIENLEQSDRIYICFLASCHFCGINIPVKSVWDYKSFIKSIPDVKTKCK